jgi:phage major head subunit gpT-like protein
MALVKNSTLQELNAVVSGKYDSAMALGADSSADVLAATDKFDAAGYVLPFIGDVPELRAWTSGSRVVKNLKEYGMRLNGTVAESTVGISVSDLNDGLVANQAKIGAGFAEKAKLHKPKALAAVLNTNAVSLFDNAALFGDHTLANPDNALDTTTYNNSISTGTGKYWYVVHSTAMAQPLAFGVRTGEDYKVEVAGGTPAGAEHTFFTDEVVVGLRTRFVAASGLWFFIVRSNKAFTDANLQEAIDLLDSFRGDRGDVLDNDATHCVVPTSLVPAAEKVLKAQLVNGGDSNTYAGKLELVVNKYLTA